MLLKYFISLHVRLRLSLVLPIPHIIIITAIILYDCCVLNNNNKTAQKKQVIIQQEKIGRAGKNNGLLIGPCMLIVYSSSEIV